MDEYVRDLLRNAARDFLEIILFILNLVLQAIICVTVLIKRAVLGLTKGPYEFIRYNDDALLIDGGDALLRLIMIIGLFLLATLFLIIKMDWAGRRRRMPPLL